MNHIRIAALTIATCITPLALHAQAPRPANEITIHAEPIAAGIRYTRALGSRVAIGPALIVGPFHGATISKDGFGELREWATAYLGAVVALTPSFRVTLQPVGAALATGDDFGAVYPSAQGGVEVVAGKMRIGSDIRILRIAGGNGSGLYWTQWVPIRVGIAWQR